MKVDEGLWRLLGLRPGCRHDMSGHLNGSTIILSNFHNSSSVFNNRLGPNPSTILTIICLCGALRSVKGATNIFR